MGMNLTPEEYESQHAEWLKADQHIRAEMNLEDQILTNIAKRMNEDINFDVFASVLCKEGWTKFEITRFIDNHHAIDIGYWLLDNCQGTYKRNGRTFLFENSKDATMFILRWG
jgi:hypothetical protein